MKPHSIVVLTGAGISAESGIKTFRDANGLWENHNIEDVASPEGFARDPSLVHRFYNTRRQQLLTKEVKPNAAHEALAKLEREFKGEFLLVTQNVDDLHERAGSKKLIHMHGEILKSRCHYSDQVYECREDLSSDLLCGCCKKKNSLRPHIVWFGEMPFEMDRIYQRLAECDLFVAIGTSGAVYPAAGFVSAIPDSAESLEINLEPSLVGDQFTHSLIGPASVQTKNWVDKLLSNCT